MDPATIIFIACVVVGFIYVRRSNSITKQKREKSINGELTVEEVEIIKRRAEEEEEEVADDIAAEKNEANWQRKLRRPKRPVTKDMVEIVQTLAPTLDAKQVTYSLQCTGSIEKTIENFLSGKEFPFPPTSPDTSKTQEVDDDEEEEELEE